MTAELILPTPFGAALRLRSDGAQITDSTWIACAPRAKPVRDPVLREAKAQIDAYLRRRLRRFDLPLHLEGTTFQCAVWHLVAQLETGELISYGEVARAIGAPLAHRGVAMAMARTPLDLLVPAHRVVGADGNVKGPGPRSMRRVLLAFEGITL